MGQRLCSVSLEFRQTFADLLRRWKTIWSFAEVAAKSCGKHPSNFRTRNTSILRQIPVLNSLVSHDRGGTGPELSPSPSRPVNSSAHRGGHVATESRSGRPALFLYNWTTRREQEGDSLSSGYLRALDSAAFIFDVPYMFFLIVFLSKVQNAVRAKTTGSDQRSRLKNLKLQHFALFNENFEKLFRG